MLIFLLIALLGFQWTLVSVMVSYARHAKGHVEHFYVVGSFIAVMSTLIFSLAAGQPILPERLAVAPIVCVALGACLQAGSNACVMITLGYDASALYLALSGLGFSISFLWSVFVWGQKMSSLNAMGLLCLVGAVFLTAFSKQKQTKDDAPATQKSMASGKRLLLALLSTLLAGGSQIMYIVPCGEYPLPPLGKTILILTTYFIIFFSIAFAKIKKAHPDFTLLVKSALPWGILALTSYLTLFKAVEKLSEINRSGIAFPLGNTIQILFFALYTRIFLKERMSAMQMAALGLIIVGIFALKM